MFKCLYLEKFINKTVVIEDWLKTFWSFLSGTFFTLIGYFLPVKNIVHLLLLFFVLDVIFGYWAARKTRGEIFSARIIWRTTMPRMVISMVLILSAFMWDQVYNQDTVATYRIIGWFISGVLLSSIVQNGYRITQWDMLLGLGEIIKQKIGERNKRDEKCSG